MRAELTARISPLTDHRVRSGGVGPCRGPEGAHGHRVAQRLLPLHAGTPGQKSQLRPGRHDLLQQHTHLSRVSPVGCPDGAIG